MSAPEETLAFQLRAMGIPFEREFRFAPPRMWRSDFKIGPVMARHDWVDRRILIEVDGGAFLPGGGRHSRGTGVEKDAEKQSAAAILGYRVIRCTPRQVDSGECLSWIERALGREEKAIA